MYAAASSGGGVTPGPTLISVGSVTCPNVYTSIGLALIVHSKCTVSLGCALPAFALAAHLVVVFGHQRD